MPLAKWPPGRESAAPSPPGATPPPADSTATMIGGRAGPQEVQDLKAWAQAAHSRRYCGRNCIVSYFERPSSAAQGGDKLRGVITLRGVEALRPLGRPAAPVDGVRRGAPGARVHAGAAADGGARPWLARGPTPCGPRRWRRARHLITEEKHRLRPSAAGGSAARHRRRHLLLTSPSTRPAESDAQYLRLGSICGSTSTTVAGSVSGDSIPPSPAPGTAPPGTAAPSRLLLGVCLRAGTSRASSRRRCARVGIVSVPDLGGPQPRPTPPPPPVATEPPPAAAKAPRRGSGTRSSAKERRRTAPPAPPSPSAAPRDPGSVGKDRSSSGGGVKFRPPGAELRASGSFLEFAHPANAMLVGAAKKIQRIERGRQARHDA